MKNGLPLDNGIGRDSNLSQNKFDFSDIKQKPVEYNQQIFERIELLETQNSELKERLFENEHLLNDANNKCSSLEKEVKYYQTAMNEIDEVDNNEKFEDFKQKTEQEYVEKLDNKTEQLRDNIDDLETDLLKINRTVVSLKKELASAYKEIEKLEGSVEDFKANFVNRAKYEKLSNKTKEVKSKLSSLEGSLTFSQIKVNELESTNKKLEKKMIDSLKECTTKADQRFEEASTKWQKKEKDLDDQIRELNDFKKKFETESGIDPQKQ